MQEMRVTPTTALPQSLGHPVLWKKRGSQGKPACDSDLMHCCHGVQCWSQYLQILFESVSPNLFFCHILAFEYCSLQP